MGQPAALFAEQASEGGDPTFFILAPHELRHEGIRPAVVVEHPAKELYPRGAWFY